jgi:hypothetical protein
MAGWLLSNDVKRNIFIVRTANNTAALLIYLGPLSSYDYFPVVIFYRLGLRTM